MNNEKNNNIIIGTICSKCVYSHKSYDEKFYKFYVETKRESGVIDILPVIVSDKIFNIDSIKENIRVWIIGEIHTFNEKIEDNSHLRLYLYAEDISQVMNDQICDNNIIELDGYICKKSPKRKTPLGRTISDVILAVNRSYCKSDYIPCVFWGKNALYTDSLDIGTRIKVKGRLQSREYIKNNETKVVYEVSIQNVNVVETV